jgi:hypothetical protein
MENEPHRSDLLGPEGPLRPPIAHASISVILLAEGPRSQTAEAVTDWRAFLAKLERPVEILVIEQPAAEEPDCEVPLEATRLEVDPASGRGAVLQCAFAAAQHPLVVLSTADRQFKPSDLNTLMGDIDQVDIAVGCRTVVPRPAWVRLLGRGFRLLGRIVLGLAVPPTTLTPGATPWRRRWAARWLFGIRLHDPECPFRLCRREAVIRILLQSKGPFALVEQLAKANHLELIMTEEPVAWTPPEQPTQEPVGFAEEARALFRDPDFGPAELHTPKPGPAGESSGGPD